jgi:hypothetical protein
VQEQTMIAKNASLKIKELKLITVANVMMDILMKVQKNVKVNVLKIFIIECLNICLTCKNSSS